MIVSQASGSRPSRSRTPKPVSHVTEVLLLRWWETLPAGTSLAGADGQSIHVLDGGSRNVHDGPDIKDAKLLVGSQVLEGDIEFHVRERDWYSHGHHNDARYDRVILHVVAGAGHRRAMNSATRRIPQLVVAPPGIDLDSDPSCHLKGVLADEVLAERLQPLIYLRWLKKVEAMRVAIGDSSKTSNTFYVQSFSALGFKGNEATFVRLSRAKPLVELRDIPSLPDLRTCLLGMGGFLETPRSPDDSCLAGQLRRWERLRRAHGLSVLVSPGEWVRKGLRPAAFPERRILFGASIVWALRRDWRPWESSFNGSCDGLRSIFGDDLPGRGWCAEWLGNIVLPFREAWHQRGGERDEHGEFARWFTLNPGYTYGKLSRRFSPHVSTRQLTNFAIQQGLLSLSDRYCKLDLCDVCPLRR
ncbi:MAG: DUF2851 family protein [Fidelibacterota bacterium]